MKTIAAFVLSALTVVSDAVLEPVDEAVEQDGGNGPGGNNAGAAETGRIFHSSVWTGKEVIVWGGGADGIFHANGWRIASDGESREAVARDGAPSGRWCHAAVWTGSRMLVWGGRDQFVAARHKGDGAAYDPVADAWKSMKKEGAPEPRSEMAAVWTGSEMIVWGGYGDGQKAWDNGARYHPGDDRWLPLPVEGAPQARIKPSAVWTGSEMIIWGGITPDLKRTLQSGARYNPATNQWTVMNPHGPSLATWGCQGIWTGTEMLVWGGAVQNGDENINHVTNEGAAYNPATNTWRSLTSEGAPAARFFHTSIWTGNSMIVWGGGDQKDSRSFNDGAEFFPAENRWLALDGDGAPPARGMHTATWTPQGMVVFGGSTGGSSAFSGPDYFVRK